LGAICFAFPVAIGSSNLPQRQKKNKK